MRRKWWFETAAESDYPDYVLSGGGSSQSLAKHASSHEIFPESGSGLSLAATATTTTGTTMTTSHGTGVKSGDSSVGNQG